jgi:hypothetical protein
MVRIVAGASVMVGLLLWYAPSPALEGGKYSLKTADTAAPKELSEPIRGELGGQSLQLYDPAGKLAGEFWFRKALPADKKVGSYRDLKQGELFGAVRFAQTWKDYRKQPIQPGVYTLRLAFQPTDGKHTADVSEYPDFLLVVGAREDAKAEPLDIKKLQEASGDSISSGHPGLFMLAPNPKPSATPELAARPREQWVIQTKAELRNGGTLGIGLTVVGHTPAE